MAYAKLLEVDGLLGPLTRDATADYQRDHGLYETTAIDQPTLQRSACHRKDCYQLLAKAAAKIETEMRTRMEGRRIDIQALCYVMRSEASRFQKL